MFHLTHSNVFKLFGGRGDPMECYVLSSGSLDFSKGLLSTSDCLSNWCTGAPELRCGWSWFMGHFSVHSQDWSLSITWCTGGQDFYWVTWWLVPGTSFHKGVFIRGWMPRYLLLWWGGQKWATSLYLGLKYILTSDKESYLIAFCFRILLAVLSELQWIGIGMGEDER